MKINMYTTAPGPIATAYLINHFHKSACQYVYILIVARKRLILMLPRGNEYTRNNGTL
jgi:hypothetical protein